MRTYAELLYKVQRAINRGGQATIFLTVRKSQVRKFLGSFSYCKFFFINPQIGNPNIFTNDAQTCLKTVLKVLLLTGFVCYVKI
jgi:hypothetical protein